MIEGVVNVLDAIESAGNLGIRAHPIRFNDIIKIRADGVVEAEARLE
jgi:hypothetical protein